MHANTSALEAKILHLIGLLQAKSWYQRASEFLLALAAPFIDRAEAKRLIKYALVGVLGTFIELSILNLLIFGVGWSSDFDKVMANVVAVSLAISSNFVWNRLWTFPESVGSERGGQFIKFLSVSLIGLVLNSVIFYAADNFFFEHLFPTVIAVQLAKFTAIAIVLVWNFTVNRFWTFQAT